jgi:peroxiredoxin
MRKFLPILLFGLLITVFANNTQNKAPDFLLPDMDGQNYSLSENFGKGPIVINFWATWCIPCREEMKELKKIYNKYKNDGLEILAISIDDPKTVSRVKNYIKSRKYPFTVLLDTNSEVLFLYQAKSPPYTVLLDWEGNIILTHSGYRKGDEKLLEKEISELIKAQTEEGNKGTNSETEGEN